MVVTEMVVFMASPFERGSQPRKDGALQDAKLHAGSPTVSPGNGEVVKDRVSTSSIRSSQRTTKRTDLTPHTRNGLVSAALFQRHRHKSVESLPTSDLTDSPALIAPYSSVGGGLDQTGSVEDATKQVLPIILKKKIKIIRGRKGFRVVSGDKGRSCISAQKRLSVSSARDLHVGAIGESPKSDLSTKHDPLTAQPNKLHYVPNHVREEASERGSKSKQSTSVEETVVQSKAPPLVGNIKKFPLSGERKSFRKEKKSVKFKLDEEESERLPDIRDVGDGEEGCVSGVRELMQLPRETAFQLVAVEKHAPVDRIADHVRTHLNLGDSGKNHLEDATSRSHMKSHDFAVKNKMDSHSTTSGHVVRTNSQRVAKDERQPQRFVRSSASRQSVKEKFPVSPGLVRRNSSRAVKSPDPDSKLLVRRCVIGGAVTFGLVQVQPPTDISNGNGYADGHGLVTIRMTPDDLGRFGFNVKGGADQGMPIIVSRVAPGTPSDLAIPRLNEGDQVLYINGRDVSQHTHEQVVMFIKASRETHSGELVLVVRPNVYVGEDQGEEPDLTYIPETHQIASSSSPSNTLDSSLMLLQESLESGAALAQFEQLYRKKPGMSMNAARNDSNIPKNRYRDISPYDQTRVVLKTASAGDYINANYVNMEIPGSGIVNRYIAAQGPLPNTCTDFWQMVWEQQSSLVVMLTTKVERGRVKCHQYWPELYETEDFGALQITCVKEEETPSFAFREFNLTHVETSEERHIRHMQYIAWPDHGVPDDPSDFLEFVMKVRQSRSGMVEPTIVHCSAGIGRTGVLITMESAMCLIEARQPVYPLSIVRQMRDQRAMLIQTSSQYKFVCEAILRVYNEGLVKPMEDYHR